MPSSCLLAVQGTTPRATWNHRLNTLVAPRHGQNTVQSGPKPSMSPTTRECLPQAGWRTANVELHAVSIGADLSKSATAMERAERINPDTIPSRERRARLMVEIARTYHQRRDFTSSLHWLEEAYAISQDSVHYSPTGRQMVSEIVDQGGALIDRRARAFAEMLGLPP